MFVYVINLMNLFIIVLLIYMLMRYQKFVFINSIFQKVNKIFELICKLLCNRKLCQVRQLIVLDQLSKIYVLEICVYLYKRVFVKSEDILVKLNLI